MSKQLFTSIIAFLLLLGTLLAWQQGQKPPKLQVPIPLIAFSLPDVTGEIHSISQWQGKILIINFWATWCPPCLKEIPEFIELQEEYAEQNVQFIGIAIDDPQLVDDYISFIDINYPILIAKEEGGQLSRKLGNFINAIPFTIIVNQQGQIILRHPGELSKQTLKELINPLVTVNFPPTRNIFQAEKATISSLLIMKTTKKTGSFVANCC